MQTKIYRATVTVNDLNAAMCSGWDQTTCILAQAIARTIGQKPTSLMVHEGSTDNGTKLFIHDWDENTKALKAQYVFDHLATSSDDPEKYLPANLTFKATAPDYVFLPDPRP